MCQLFAGGRLEASHHYSLWIQFPKYVADHPILTAGIHALDDYQHGVSVLGIQEILQFVQMEESLLPDLYESPEICARSKQLYRFEVFGSETPAD